MDKDIFCIKMALKFQDFGRVIILRESLSYSILMEIVFKEASICQKKMVRANILGKINLNRTIKER